MTMSGDNAIPALFQSHESNVQVQGSGTVIKVLREDDEGTRHQKFLLRLASGQTILIAHNIDIAGRIDDYSDVAAVREKLHHLLTFPCELCPTRVRGRVLFHATQDCIAELEIHFSQLGSAGSTDRISYALQSYRLRVFCEDLLPHGKDRVFQAHG